MNWSRWQRRLSPALAPASWIYGMVVARRMRRFDRKPELARALPCPVISVGNLSVGGSGKTPMVARVAKSLVEAGERVAILSRGYGRDEAHTVRLVFDGEEFRSDLNVSGDEPYELAAALPGVSVAVATNRYDAGKLVLDELDRLDKLDKLDGPDGLGRHPSTATPVFVLDDGFQHRQLHRDLDIVCMDPTRSPSEMKLLPQGIFREELEALSRADAIVWTYWSASATTAPAVERVNEWLAERRDRDQTVPAVFYARYQARESAAIHGEGELAAIDWTRLKGSPVAVLAGIAQPNRFVEDLVRQGFDIRHTCLREDHHWWRQEEVDLELQRAADKGAAFALTTGKDASKLRVLRPGRLSLRRVRQSVTFESDPEWLEWLLGALGSPAARHGA